MTERWQVAGTAAEAYERYLVPACFGPFADRLIELAAPVATDRVLDVACGTGVVARRIAPLVSTTTGVDLNEGMLAVARAAEPAVDGRAAEHNPGWPRLAGALDRHAGEAGAMMRAPFSLSDGAELRDLVRSAGFADVSVRIRVVPVRSRRPATS